MNLNSRNPVQKRSIDTKNKLIESGIFLFSKKGFYKTNSKDIARHAGVAIGSFYSYFNDKKEFLIETLERFNEIIFSKIKEYQEINEPDLSNPDIYIINLINNVINAHEILPEFHEEIIFLMHTDPDIKKIMKKCLNQSIKMTFNSLYKIKDHLKVKDINTASEIVFITVEEIVHHIIFNKKNHERKQLIDELSDMIKKYLFQT